MYQSRKLFRQTRQHVQKEIGYRAPRKPVHSGARCCYQLAAEELTQNQKFCLNVWSPTSPPLLTVIAEKTDGRHVENKLF